MRKIQKVVITGATGIIGMSLCKKLYEYGIEIYAICRPHSPRAVALEQFKNIHCIWCDVSNLEQLPKLLPNDIDAFYHLAWTHTSQSGRNDISAQILNIQNTIAAVQASYRLNCSVFIGAGSQAEYGISNLPLTAMTPCFPQNGYGIAKLCAGQMSRLECFRLGIEHIWPRILSVYGPYDGSNTMISQTVRDLLSKKCPALTKGEQIWDYLYADDAAEALYLMALKGKNGAIYPLGSGQARPLKEYIEILRDAIDPNLPLDFGKIPYSPTSVMHLQADINALTKDLGFIPRTKFQEGICKTIAWIKRNDMLI